MQVYKSAASFAEVVPPGCNFSGSTFNSVRIYLKTEVIK